MYTNIQYHKMFYTSLAREQWFLDVVDKKGEQRLWFTINRENDSNIKLWNSTQPNAYTWSSYIVAWRRLPRRRH